MNIKRLRCALLIAIALWSCVYILGLRAILMEPVLDSLETAGPQRISKERPMPESLEPPLHLPQFQFALENLADGPHFCGYRKCLFPLKHDERFGYLAGCEADDAAFQEIKDGYDVSVKIIQEKFAMRHIYLAPPKLLTVDDHFRKWMGRNQTGGYSGQKHFPYFHRQILIQLVEIIPLAQSLTFGCKGPRLRDGNKKMDVLFNTQTTAGVDVKAIIDQATSDFQKLYRLLEEQPCLYKDFQIFLTTNGHLVHFDVERCFPMSSFEKDARRGEVCVPKIKEFETKLLQTLERLQTPTTE